MTVFNVLTVQHPWALLIALGFKRIENRDWPAPHWLVQKGNLPPNPLLIHASKKVPSASGVREVLQWAQGDAGLPAFNLQTVMNVLEASAGRIVGKTHILRNVTDPEKLDGSQEPYFFGPHGWLLAPVEPMLSEPIRGSLGVWKTPVDFTLPPVSREWFSTLGVK